MVALNLQQQITLLNDLSFKNPIAKSKLDDENLDEEKKNVTTVEKMNDADPNQSYGSYWSECWTTSSSSVDTALTTINEMDEETMSEHSISSGDISFDDKNSRAQCSSPSYNWSKNSVEQNDIVTRISANAANKNSLLNMARHLAEKWKDGVQSPDSIRSQTNISGTSLTLKSSSECDGTNHDSYIGKYNDVIKFEKDQKEEVIISRNKSEIVKKLSHNISSLSLRPNINDHNYQKIKNSNNSEKVYESKRKTSPDQAYRMYKRGMRQIQDLNLKRAQYSEGKKSSIEYKIKISPTKVCRYQHPVVIPTIPQLNSFPDVFFRLQLDAIRRQKRLKEREEQSQRLKKSLQPKRKTTCVQAYNMYKQGMKQILALKQTHITSTESSRLPFDLSRKTKSSSVFIRLFNDYETRQMRLEELRAKKLKSNITLNKTTGSSFIFNRLFNDHNVRQMRLEEKRANFLKSNTCLPSIPALSCSRACVTYKK